MKTAPRVGFEFTMASLLDRQYVKSNVTKLAEAFSPEVFAPH